MKHPQYENLIIAANDEDALFECEHGYSANIKEVLKYPSYNWTHVDKFSEIRKAEKEGKQIEWLSITGTWCPKHIDAYYNYATEYRIKPAYKYQHVKDAYEANNSLVVQFRYDCDGDSIWMDSCLLSPAWHEGCQYRIKPKTITKRLYASCGGLVKLLSEPNDVFTIPINGTDTEVECE